MSKYSEALAVCLIFSMGLQPAAWSGCVTPSGVVSSTNPDDRYVISLNNQEVYDPQTDITWQRCPYGWFVSPDGKSCMQLQANAGAWTHYCPLSREFMYPGRERQDPCYGHNLGPRDWAARGWRLPSRTNLFSLIDHTCQNPAINQVVFPSTPPGYFWTSDYKYETSHGRDYWYVVNFAGEGRIEDHEDINAWPIRLMYKGKTPEIQITLQKRPVAAQ